MIAMNRTLKLVHKHTDAVSTLGGQREKKTAVWEGNKKNVYVVKKKHKIEIVRIRHASIFIICDKLRIFSRIVT